MSKTSPYYVTREKAIRDTFGDFKKNSLTPWCFFNAGKEITIENRRGSKVNYGGIKFDGSPETVFWNSFFWPCIEDIIAEQFEASVDTCIDDKYFEDNALTETADLLRSHVTKFLNDMAEVDQLIKGEGFPNNVKRRSVDKEIARFNDDIDRHLHSARQKIGHRKPNFWRANQWWIQLLIAAAASIPGWIALFKSGS